MFAYLLGGASLVALGTAAASPFVINWLADGDSFFTKVSEGTAKAVMRGGTRGSFDHFVMAFEGHHFNVPGSDWFDRTIPAWEVLDNDPVDDKYFDLRDPLTKWLGVYYVGIPPFRQLKEYRFRWSEAIKDLKTNKEVVWSRDASTDFIYVSDFPYMIVLDAAETKEGIPVDGTYQLVIRITNPYKALFATENWLEAVTASANRAARSYVGSRTYEELQSETNKEDDELHEHPGDDSAPHDPDDFSCPMTMLTDVIPEDRKNADKWKKGLRGRYGVTIVAANLQTIAINTGSAELDGKVFESTILEFTSKKDADRITTLGKAEAEKIRVIGDAEAARIYAEGKAEADVITLKGKAEARSIIFRLYAWNKGGEMSKLIAQLDAMASPGPNKTVIWANNPFVSQYPGLAQALDALGIKDVEALKEILKGFEKNKGKDESS